MNTIKKTFAFALVLALLVLATPPAQAQASFTVTTLGAALTARPAPTAVVLASFPSGFAARTWSIYVDMELMQVTGLIANTNGTTIGATVARGAGGTQATAHGTTAPVYVGKNEWFASGTTRTNPIQGSCTSTAELVLPVIDAPHGVGWDCRSSGQWFRIFTGGTMGWSGQAVRAFCTGTAGSAETEYLNGAACSSATTATARQVISAPGTLANLRVFSSAGATGGTNKDVITVYKNGSSTALTCTIAASGTACSDVTHSVAVAAGDVITFQFVSATSDTAANVSASVEKY